MRRERDVRHLGQRARDLGLVLEDVEPRARDGLLGERHHQCLLVDDLAARRIDEERRRLHQGQLARADLVHGFRLERRMQ